MDIDKDKPVYVISVVSEMLSVPQQTLRIYEKANLVNPNRTRQNTRLYSQSDIEKLRKIITLHQDMGINLAGIEVIMHLRARMDQMQGEFQDFFDKVHDRMNIDDAFDPKKVATSLVPLSPRGSYIIRLIDSKINAEKERIPADDFITITIENIQEDE